MEDDLNPGWTTPPLPPFVARPVSPGSGGDKRPLPPWTSARRELEPSAPPEPVPALQEAEMQPEPVEVWTLETVAEEDSPDQLWTLEIAEAYVETETSTAEAEAPWLMPAEQPGVAEEPWAAIPLEPEAQEEPWTFEAAEPLPEESTWTLEPAMDVVVESWADQVPEIIVEPPLATFPGEAEAWEAVAAPPVPELASEIPIAPEPADPRYIRMAELLETFAAELRTHGAGALTRGLTRDRLSAALAGFVAGFEAASQQD